MFDQKFNEEYEAEVQRIAALNIDDEHVLTLLKDKREFGLAKYKDISFQSNEENAMKVDTVQHAKEEMIDLMNYLIHERYKCKNRMSVRPLLIEKLIRKTYKLYRKIERL